MQQPDWRQDPYRLIASRDAGLVVRDGVRINIVNSLVVLHLLEAHVSIHC